MPKYQVEEVKHFVVPRHTGELPLMVAIKMQDIKARRGQRASSQINSGGQVSVDQAVQNCRHCQLYRGREEKAPMVPMMVTASLQLVHLDFTLFEMTTNLNESPKVKNILVIVDHFTRYTRAYVTKDQKASTAAKTLYEVFILILGHLKGSLRTKARSLPMRW